MLDRLILTDFRNHAEAALRPGPGFVVLTGDNGAGKTNVLEAVSLLAPGRGLRRAPLSQMARQGGDGGFGVAARMDDVELATGTRPDTPDRRVVRINGAAASANALAEWLTVLWLTPAMDRLFIEGAGERRRFLDRLTLAFAPGHAAHANRYEAAMRARTRLLTGDAPPDPAWLAALEAQMAEHGAAIGRARRETVAALAGRLADTDDAQFPGADLLIEGWAAGDLARELAAGRARDAAAGRALAGPHRQDLQVAHRAKAQPAGLCSTGEQKALLLAIVLAHADLIAERLERPPVLLLDEVAAHLDPARRAALFERLAGRGQVWMTGTERAPFADLGEASWFAVTDGRISAG
ncbi:DNA replication/repair protein RecF [Sphingomonas gilva]|uniref:DNA replication and repair protein RecF n=1 Tax=Sphingomonas gilva TaxID=2305907 RepID=A0A396RQB3_9SPHN|nr:DNA replication/repair protein RecF [Sphingomonas gilva]RHW18784.1 DNA replication/repair protein RecF [Sphingomonas gilva]